MNLSAVDDQSQTPLVVIHPTRGLTSLKLGEIWEFKDLLYLLIWKDIIVRYKQTLLGVAWAVLQPVINMVIFSFLFGYLLNTPTNGAPYPIFLYSAMLSWNYFANTLNRSSQSLVNNAVLLTKVYFPRLALPLSGIISGLLDFALAFLVLIVLMIYYKVYPTINTIFLPIFILLTMVTALGFGLWLSALNVRYRDINYITPFIVQIWMYLTPIIYSSTILPERFRFLIWLNPMTIVVEGFRWALLGEDISQLAANPLLPGLSLCILLAVLVSGLLYFKTTERVLADVI